RRIMSVCTSQVNPAGAAWSARADELAGWTLRRLANRTDAWGGYRPEHEIGREYTRPDGTKGRLGAQQTVRGELTLGRRARHYRGRGPPGIIGLHSAGAATRAGWGAVDIDHHGPQSTAADINLAAALHWYGELARRGFRPLLTGSNGRGGYHLRVLLAA